MFVAAVVGGLGTIAGAVLGALFLRGTQWFITAPEWRFLSSAVGVLLVLLVLPGGLASLFGKLRDVGVRWLLGRAGPDELAPPDAAVTEPSAVEDAAAALVAAAKQDAPERALDPAP